MTGRKFFLFMIALGLTFALIGGATGTWNALRPFGVGAWVAALLVGVPWMIADLVRRAQRRKA